MATSLGNIGSVYDDQGDYVKAMDYYSQALKLSEELNLKDGIAIWLGDIGMVYEKQKKYDEALDYYFRALKIAKETGNETTIAVELRSIGSFYSDQGKYRESENYLLEALALDEESGALLEVMGDEEELHTLYSKTGRYEQALEHYKHYAAVKDSIYNEENIAKSVRTEMNFGFEKQAAIQKAEHDKTVVALEAKNRIATNTRNFIIVLAVMLLLLLSLGFTWFNNRKHLRVKKSIRSSSSYHRKKKDNGSPKSCTTASGRICFSLRTS